MLGKEIDKDPEQRKQDLTEKSAKLNASIDEVSECFCSQAC